MNKILMDIAKHITSFLRQCCIKQPKSQIVNVLNYEETILRNNLVLVLTDWSDPMGVWLEFDTQGAARSKRLIKVKFIFYYIDPSVS